MIKLTIILLCITIGLKGQDTEIDLLIENELKMTFPSIHFKHNSTNYAPMPYKTDSCFKYIALNYNKDINSLVIWRDSSETEELTRQRIQILQTGLKKYIKIGSVAIHSMGQEQKVSRQTISKTSDKSKIDYLLALNSVFDISKTHISPGLKKKKARKRLPHLVWTGWRTGFHWSTLGKVQKKSKGSK